LKNRGFLFFTFDNCALILVVYGDKTELILQIKMIDYLAAGGDRVSVQENKITTIPLSHCVKN